jgi:hypothetical protein
LTASPQRYDRSLALPNIGWLARQRADATSREVPTARVAQGGPTPVYDVIAKIVSFLRAGYPQGVPATDTFALLALLCRRLSDEEAFAAPAGKRQAEYFRALLKQEWAKVCEQIATDYAALARYHDGGDLARRILRRIAKHRREQFELEQLLAQLQCRFFGRTVTPAPTASPSRRFDVSVNRHGSWWSVTIPDLGEHVSARHYEDVEVLTRAHISAILDAPISEIAVAILAEQKADIPQAEFADNRQPPLNGRAKPCGN